MRSGKLLQRELDDRFKATGHQNVYFPLLIPQSFLQKEAGEHVEGFAPELAVVTHAGGKELEEPDTVIRPTSETIIGHFFAKMDPQLSRPADAGEPMGQRHPLWSCARACSSAPRNSCGRRAYTAHSTHEEALEEVLRMLDVYADASPRT